jgi:flagellar hook-length control protein FliK
MDTAAEVSVSGKGLHINSSQPSESSRSLFNRILHQGMTPRELSAKCEADGAGENAEGETEPQENNITIDVSALLVQLNVLGANAMTADNPVTADTVAGAAGLAEIPDVIMSSQEMASELAGLPDVISENAGLTAAAGVTGDQSFKTAQVIAEIAEAMTTAEAPEETVTGTSVMQKPSAAAAAASDVPVAAAALSAAKAADGARETGETIEPQETFAGKVSADEGRDASKTESKTAASDSGAYQPAAVKESGMTSPDGGGTAGDSRDGGEDGQADMTADAGERVKTSATPMSPAGLSEPGNSSDISAPDKAAAVEKAFLRLSEDVRGLRAGRQEINIVLEPESLGVLTISVIRTEKGISAMIRSEDREICSIMSDRLHQLVSSMEARGITVQEVDVAYNPENSSADFSQQAFSQQRESASGGNKAPREQRHAREPETAPVEDAGDGSGNATVEYRV